MKIVQILPELNGGGVERGTLDFAHELVRLGHESIVISNGGELVPRLTLRGSRHIDMPVHKKSLWSLRLVGRLRRLLEELQPDVLHARSRMPAWIAWLAWRGMPEERRPRLVTTAHGLYSANFYSAIMASGERVIAVSQCVADYLQQHYGKKLRTPPRVIHRGVNTREFDRRAPISGQWQLRLLNDYPQLEGKNWLLMPARLTPWKGQRTFLQMLAAVSRQRDDVFGLVVGAADTGKEKYARELEQLALELGLSDKVLFLGQRRDMRELYASSQITYNLSEHPEPFGRTVAEALAMNCPVVSYNDGGPSEVLHSCFPQGLVERGDLDALVQTSLQILDRPQSIDFTGFSLEEMTSQTLEVYQELCAG
ncbi:glycosyltransferase family 4 protein [Microbulbifer sp.]|uniref:glycosyltransferase family 4 protein n=1 Tax=Microbulbifer sp. TaxID=1908541 RepID=UPI003F3A45D0